MGKKRQRKLAAKQRVGSSAATSGSSLASAKTEPLLGRAEMYLFGGLLLAVVVRLAGIFSTAELPNWDSPGHYFALGKMAEYLQQGHMSGYLHEWLGGIELFRFYPPLFYAVTAGFWLITFKLIPLALLYRLAVLLAVFSAAVSLWFFVRVFLGALAARWAIVLSAAFIFYPNVFSMVGIGGGAALWVGLVPNALGLSLAFIWLGLMERLRQQPQSYARLLAGSLVGAALALTHTLSFIFAGLLFGFWLAAHLVQRRTVRRPLHSVIVSFGLAAFWLLPFLSGLYLTAGSERGETANPVYLMTMFPFRIPYLEMGIIAIAALALAGTIIVAKRQRWGLLAIWLGAIAFFLLRGPISQMLPSLGIHYYRFLAFIYFLQLAVACQSLAWLWERWADGVRRRQVYLVLLVGLVALSYYATFDAYEKSNQEPGGNFRSPLQWQWDDYPLTDEGSALADKLAAYPNAVRVHFEKPWADTLLNFGSHLFFAVRLPLDHRQAVSGGLFVESSPLTPFMLASIKSIQVGFNPLWGDERLRQITPFSQQGTGQQLARLAHLGVSHFVTYTSQMEQRVSAEPMAELTDSTEHFRVFALGQAKPLIYAAAYRPGVYLSSYGESSFRDLALALYAGTESYDYPLAESRISVNDLLNQENVQYSAVFVSGSGLTAGDVNSLKLLPVPIVLLNPGEEVRLAAAGADSLHLIDGFTVVPKGSRQLYADYPAGWSQLWDIVREIKSGASLPATNLQVIEHNGQLIRFIGSGPVVINSGYSPRWQADNGEMVARLTPDIMLVWADPDQETVLRYRKRLPGHLGLAISVTTVGFLLGWAAYRRRQKEEAV